MKYSMSDRKQTEKLKIVSVKVLVETDTDADLSYIGEYTHTAGPDDKTIDREARGDMLRGQYRYFVAAMSCEETGNPESVEQDYQHMEDYERQGWCMMGVRAVAIVSRNIGGACQTHKFESAGLWGIESDSERSYFQEVAGEELSQLKDILKDFGVPTRSFAALAKQAKESM